MQLRKPVTELGGWRYVMVPAPDGVLIELFEVTPDKLPSVAVVLALFAAACSSGDDDDAIARLRTVRIV